ncbi:hypothetical protein D9757_014265 [Collybiopsis confluens]|uniref:SNF2 N-terminal domain-containing protein n=1 Tax=Collybiopsis confluens TaxID=2823264 RepID=A0A8H5GD90_9AGAR|nr:hypothetical protein D9757_014265 [Collybiopsis confluens]
MAPKAKRTAKRKGKGKTNNVDVTAVMAVDTAQTARQASRKLAHMYWLAFQYPEVITPFCFVMGNKVILSEPTLRSQWRLYDAIPFWHTKCPPGLEDKWGLRWAAIYGALKAMSKLLIVTAVNKFKRKENSMDEVARQARINKWDSCMNDEIERVWEEDGKGIKVVYCTLYMYKQVRKEGSEGGLIVKGFVSLGHWDAHTGVLVPKVLGIGMRSPMSLSVPIYDLKTRFVEPDANKIQKFHRRVVNFANSWLGRWHPENLDTAIELYFDPNFKAVHKEWSAEGRNIGTAEFSQQLHGFLGFVDGLPLTFRRYAANEPNKILSNVTDLEGIHPSAAGLENAPVAIRHKWATVPGMCLFDEVGLGKTLCAMTAIGAFQNVFALQEEIVLEMEVKQKDCNESGIAMPKFAAVEDWVPARPHLVVVPPSLVDQWMSKLQRFFRTD